MMRIKYHDNVDDGSDDGNTEIPIETFHTRIRILPFPLSLPFFASLSAFSFHSSVSVIHSLFISHVAVRRSELALDYHGERWTLDLNHTIGNFNNYLQFRPQPNLWNLSFVASCVLEFNLELSFD